MTRNTLQHAGLTLLIVTLTLMLVAMTASADGPKPRYWLHHESQGKGDPSFDKCMPEPAANAHVKQHEGDKKGERCDDPAPTSQPTNPPNPTAVPTEVHSTPMPPDPKPTTVPTKVSTPKPEVTPSDPPVTPKPQVTPKPTEQKPGPKVTPVDSSTIISTIPHAPGIAQVCTGGVKVITTTVVVTTTYVTTTTLPCNVCTR